MVDRAREQVPSVEACPLCDGDASLAERDRSRTFFACPRCDLVFVPHREHLPPAQERARYERHQNAMENIGYVQMFTRKIRLMRRTWQGVRRVLDYGCGPGPVLVELLRRIGYDAYGYDPYFAPQMPPGPFDAVVSTEAFEHFASPRRELDRIAALLRPGGYLNVMTRLRPAGQALRSWWYARDPTHVAFYSQATFRWIAKVWGYRECYSNADDFIILKKC